MRISVVVSAYNAAGFLRQTIASVAAQSSDDWECVIVDDGSSDSTRAVAGELAAGDPRIRIVAQQNGGVAAARNRGFRESDPASEYILFLDHDDLLAPDALQCLVAALSASPQALASHGLALACGVNRAGAAVAPHVKHRRRKSIDGPRGMAALDEPTTVRMLAWDNCITTTGCVLFRRRALEMTGLFDPGLEPLDDWDLYFRVARIAPLAFVDRVVVEWRLHAANTSHNKHLMNRATCLIRQKMLGSPDMDDATLALVRKRFRRMYRSEFRHDAIDLAQLAARAMRAGRPGVAARHAGGALARYAGYLLYHVYWTERLYGRDIPVRVRDGSGNARAATRDEARA